jgi:predicted GIY-YIG superfamily endonuclease
MTRSIYSVYMLKCADGSYYVGFTSNLSLRMAEHEAGLPEGSYTSKRLPVKLVWSAEFSTRDDAFRRERQLKGWSRAKKEALIRGDWDEIHEVVKRERKEKDIRKRKAR